MSYTYPERALRRDDTLTNLTSNNLNSITTNPPLNRIDASWLKALYLMTWMDCLLGSHLFAPVSPHSPAEEDCQDAHGAE